MKNFIKLISTGLLLMTIANCGGGGTSISTSSTSDAFDEDDLGFNPKMDILFVVDPSKSMFEEVEKVRNNISVFIEGFIELDYEYRVGVISSSAWSAYAYNADNNLTFLAPTGIPFFGKLHKGECVDRIGAATQDAYLDSLNTAGVGAFLSKFSKNFDVYGTQLNTSGCGLVGPPFVSPAYSEVPGNFFEDANGYSNVSRQQAWEYINDERPLQSIQAFLEYDATLTGVDKFVRSDAHLAIIIVSDEPDASRDSLTPSLTFIPGAPGNHTAQQYIDFLTNYKDDPTTTSINEGQANFSIYSIVDIAFTGNIAEDVAALSGGAAFDINATTSEYVDNLSQISQAILVSSSFFPIAYRPIPSTIQIQIFKETGEIIVVPANGFVYLPTQQGVTLTSQYLPALGDSLKINYVPAELINGISEQPRLTLNDTSINERPVSAGSSLNPGDVGYDADTNTKNGIPLGTVSLLFGNATGGLYSIVSSIPVGAYSIDSTTGVISVANANLFDSEDQGKHQIDVALTLPDTSTLNRSFLISIQDIPDVTPVSANDSYTVSETLADANNNIRILGNVTYNDTNIDGSETHVWQVVANVAATSGSPSPGSPSLGSPNLVLNPNGSFELNITDASALALGSGDDVTYTFTYRIVGTPGTEISNTSTVSITVEGFNQAPYLSLVIPNQEVSFAGGEVNVPFVVGDITSSGVGSGSLANLIDGNTATNFETASAVAHNVRLDFPGTSLYEVNKFEINGASGHSLGNSIFQVLSSTGATITREVLPVTTAAGSMITVTMDQKVIGGGVRIIRPVGSKNAQGHDNLRLSEIVVKGVLAQDFTINLTNHFTDPDVGDTLTFYVTDEYGEGPAPGWITVLGNNLTGVPPSGADTNVGVIAEDGSGSTAFTVFNIKRIGAGGGAPNGPPIAVLPLDDSKRGGITMKRYGGGSSSANPQLNNQIVWGEIDNFFVDPTAGDAIADALTGSGLCPSPFTAAGCNLQATGYRTNPASIPAAIAALLPANQINHFGDNYSTENGWFSTPVYTDLKYPSGNSLLPQGSGGQCWTSTYITTANQSGKIYPCISGNNGTPGAVRSYGETYSGYFVPAKTGIYRFRTRSIDDNIRLFLAPTEYLEDLTPVVTVSYCVSSMVTMTQSIAPGLNTTTTCSSEFRGTPGGPTGNQNGAAVGAPTQIFFEGTTQSYKNGYTLLKQGNVYAFELRFAEGGGSVAFEFEYDRKDQSCDPTTNSPTSNCWDGFQPIDASVVVPAEGSDAHTPQVISAPANIVSLDVKTLFYDAEQDILDYTARLVNPDGTQYLTGAISEIGLTLNAQTGALSGELNAGYLAANPRPRIVFTATERFTANQAATSSLPIKFNPN